MMLSEIVVNRQKERECHNYWALSDIANRGQSLKSSGI